ALSHDFLRRLKISWSVLGKRVYSRKDRNSKLDIIIGLSATHKAMLRQVYDEDGHIDSHNSDDSQLIRMVDAQSKYQAKTIKSETDANPDVWEMVYDTGGRIRMTPDNILSVPSSTPIKSENTKVYCTDDNWMLINESAGGYCMQCDTSCGSNIRVGEIIGITTDDTNKDEWSLGILRWMRTYGDTGVKVGGQFIGKGVIPVAVSIAYDNSGNNNSVSLQRALLVPAIRAIGKSSSIITHTSRYRIGHIVNMHLKLKIVQIKLTRENILSGLYSEFEYEQVNKTLITHDEFDSQDVSSKNVDFKDVWSNF
ncbi:MAG: hypothetical protein OEY89_15025, partial [Gammaproteobacteria bacterium]|nr:hypothetical protein [Gammaproteobacteria bacterium]